MGLSAEAASNRNQALARLEQLGLTPNEAKLYLALLAAPRATTAELGEISSVPRSKIYGVLRSLENKGFALALGGQVARFQAVASKVALEVWATHRQHERDFASDADQRLVEELSLLLTEAEPTADPEPAYIEGVSGKARIAEASEQLLNLARKRLLMVQQPPYFQAPSHWNKLEIDAVHRGVDVRVIYSRAAVLDERRYRPLLEVGANLRVLEGVAPMKLISRDGDEALVALRDPLTGEQGVTSAVIHHPDLVSAIELLFEKEWDRAEELASVLIREEQATG
jgi:sugar-specific transcriptional regulator TrmB